MFLKQKIIVGTKFCIERQRGLICVIQSVGGAVGSAHTHFDGGKEAVPHIHRRHHIVAAIRLPEKLRHAVPEVKSHCQGGYLGITGVNLGYTVATKAVEHQRIALYINQFLALAWQEGAIGRFLNRRHIALALALRIHLAECQRKHHTNQYVE